MIIITSNNWDIEGLRYQPIIIGNATKIVNKFGIVLFTF